MTNLTLPTANKAWGYYGTSGAFADADAAWGLAFAAILAATQGAPEGVRDFLDSRHGRHLADDVCNGMQSGLDLPAAIDAAITRWMDWSLDRHTARKLAVPAGLPYLEGLVLYFSPKARAA